MRKIDKWFANNKVYSGSFFRSYLSLFLGYKLDAVREPLTNLLVENL